MVLQVTTTIRCVLPVGELTSLQHSSASLQDLLCVSSLLKCLWLGKTHDVRLNHKNKQLLKILFIRSFFVYKYQQYQTMRYSYVGVFVASCEQPCALKGQVRSPAGRAAWYLIILLCSLYFGQSLLWLGDPSSRLHLSQLLSSCPVSAVAAIHTRRQSADVRKVGDAQR